LKVESGVKDNPPFEAQGKETLSCLRFAECGNNGKKSKKKRKKRGLTQISLRSTEVAEFSGIETWRRGEGIGLGGIERRG
jgi:hypothetical protein